LLAQTYYTGTLDRIVVRKSPISCSEVGLVNTTYPPASDFSVSLTSECKKSSIVLDLSMTVPQITSRAVDIGKGKVRFETAIPGGLTAKATYSIPAGWSTRLSLYYPPGDLAPSSGGTCVNTESKAGKNSGTWTETLTAPECQRNKEQYLNNAEAGGKFFVVNTQVSAYLLNDPEKSDAEGVSMQAHIELWYRADPPSKVTITSTTPAAGERQDPFGSFSFTAQAGVELLTGDPGQVALRLYEAEGTLVAESPTRPVERGSSSVSLRTSLSDIPELPERGPRNPVEYRLIAVLLDRNGRTLAQSDPVVFPVWCDLSIDQLEGVQVTQRPDHSIPLVAHKPTFVRAYAKLGDYRGDSLRDIELTVRGYRDGVELPGSPVRSVGDTDSAFPAPDRASGSLPSVLLPMDWTTAGAITVRAEINPPGERHFEEQDSANNQASLTLQFQDRPAFSIRTVRVCHPGEGGAQECASGMGGEAFLTLLNMFPVAWDGPNALDFDTLDTPPVVWSTPLATVAEWDRLLGFLELLYGSVVGDSGMPFSQLMAWLPVSARAPASGGGSMQGLSAPIWAGYSGRAFVVKDLEPQLEEVSIQVVIAHEAGHNFGLTHSDPPPACDTAEAELGEIGIRAFPYEFFEPHMKNLMVNCSRDQMWISPDQYMSIWESGFEPPVTAGPVQAKNYRASAEAESGECVLLQGTAQRETGSVALGSLQRVPCARPPAGGASGNHCLRFLDANDTLLSTWCFQVSFLIPGVPDPLDERTFVVKAPLPAGAQRLALMRGDQELASRSASANPPSVSFSAPLSGDRWTGGVHTLSWSGADVDGDSLTYTLLYSADNRATWLPLQIGMSESSLTLDPASIRGGKSVFFRVLAGDGFFTTVAEAGPLEVVQTPVAEVSQSTMDFLNVLPGAHSVQRVAIANRGDGPLTVQSAMAGGMFQVLTILPLRVPAGDSRWISVQFRPTAKGAAAETLVIATGDAAHPEFRVDLTGVGAAANTPELEVIPQTLDFGSVVKDQSASLTLRLRNRGPAPLTLSSISVEGSAFAAAPLETAIPLPAGAVQDFSVTFTPDALGAVSGNLTIISDDPKSPETKVPLKGSGVAK